MPFCRSTWPANTPAEYGDDLTDPDANSNNMYKAGPNFGWSDLVFETAWVQLGK